MKTIKLMIIFLMIFFLSSVFAADMSVQAIKKRIEPIGKVNVRKVQRQQQQVETDQQDEKPETAQPSEISGKAVYESNCKLCHETGTAGAPKLGDAEAWKPLIKKGLNTLVNHAIQGYKAMPPKGGCMGCSDADIKAAVEYMIAQSQ